MNTNNNDLEIIAYKRKLTFIPLSIYMLLSIAIIILMFVFDFFNWAAFMFLLIIFVFCLIVVIYKLIQPNIVIMYNRLTNEFTINKINKVIKIKKLNIKNIEVYGIAPINHNILFESKKKKDENIIIYDIKNCLKVLSRINEICSNDEEKSEK